MFMKKPTTHFLQYSNCKTKTATPFGIAVFVFIYVFKKILHVRNREEIQFLVKIANKKFNLAKRF